MPLPERREASYASKTNPLCAVTWTRNIDASHSKYAGPYPVLRSDRDLLQKCKGSSSGITLIEILVVVAVLGVLGSFMLPALAGAKKKAQTAKCCSNLRQLAVIVRVYADENAGRLPSISPGSGESDAGLRALMPDKVPVRAILRCPSDIGSIDTSSYAWNHAMNGKTIDDDRASGSRAAEHILSDRGPWHGYRNAVYPDGHVEKLR